MTNVVAVAVQLGSARVGLHQEPIRKTSLSEHSAVGRAFVVSPNVAASRPWINTVAVYPPCGFRCIPIIGPELERPHRTSHVPGARRRLMAGLL